MKMLGELATCSLKYDMSFNVVIIIVTLEDFLQEIAGSLYPPAPVTRHR